ncbi:MAG: cytochrome c oxidase subunit 4 [Nitrospiraceae bacterium]|nr:cytochrome c oxidase subunit 4 [Nitrospiraceae bacterium]
MQDGSENRYGSKGFSPDNGQTLNKGQEIPEGWSIPKPEAIPAPTYWPLMLSFGAALMGLGVLTSNIIAVTGIILFIIAIVKWVGELYHEKRQ